MQVVKARVVAAKPIRGRGQGWHGFPAQVPTVVEQAKAALAAGHAVVIGLQATGEAAAQALDLRPGQVCTFLPASRD